MKISDLTINNSCFGKDKILVDIRPYYNYGSSSKEIEGYKYKVVLPFLKMEPLDVKIPGAKLLELKEGEFPSVEFEGLEARIYVIEGKGLVSASATGMRVLGNQHKA